MKRKNTAVVEMPERRNLPTKTIVEQIASKRAAFPLQEFADLTGISYKTAFAMVRDGRLPAMRIGSSIRLDPKTTAEWLRQRTSN